MYSYTRAKDYSSTQKQGIFWTAREWYPANPATPSKHCANKTTTHYWHHWVSSEGLVWGCSGRKKKTKDPVPAESLTSK